MEQSFPCNRGMEKERKNIRGNHHPLSKVVPTFILFFSLSAGDQPRLYYEYTASYKKVFFYQLSRASVTESSIQLYFSDFLWLYFHQITEAYCSVALFCWSTNG